MVKFQNICGGPDEATAILSYLTECGKARYLSKEQKELVEVCHYFLLHNLFFISAHSCSSVRLCSLPEDYTGKLVTK